MYSARLNSFAPGAGNRKGGAPAGHMLGGAWRSNDVVAVFIHRVGRTWLLLVAVGVFGGLACLHEKLLHCGFAAARSSFMSEDQHALRIGGRRRERQGSVFSIRAPLCARSRYFGKACVRTSLYGAHPPRQRRSWPRGSYGARPVMKRWHDVTGLHDLESDCNSGRNCFLCWMRQCCGGAPRCAVGVGRTRAHIQGARDAI